MALRTPGNCLCLAQSRHLITESMNLPLSLSNTHSYLAIISPSLYLSVVVTETVTLRSKLNKSLMLVRIG